MQHDPLYSASKCDDPHPTCFVPRVLFQEKLRSIRYALSVAGDYDFMLRLYSQGYAFRQIDRVLANFTRGGACDTDLVQSKRERVV